MATKSGITVTTEIIPSSDLPQLPQALTQLEELEAHVASLTQAARNTTITDDASFVTASELNAQYKEAQKSAENISAPYESILRKCRDFIVTRKQRVTNAVSSGRDDILVPKLDEWMRKVEEKDRAEKAAAKAEEERLQKLETQRLQREAEEKRRKDLKAAAERQRIQVAQIKADLKSGKITKMVAAKLLKACQATNEADVLEAEYHAEQAKANAATQASTLKVQPNLTHVSDVAGNTKRTNFKAECTNPNAYILAVCEAYKKGNMAVFDRLVLMLEVSNERLGAEARKTKSNAEMQKFYPFVKAWDEKSF